ncbi:uncharacterized protein LOC129279967 [Lytechinus pictus]|uniref:uncharacterized protein LOC129279967 n=1 Tax=Lytechinus pictus TaxID=7653 RepID=UPI0030B9AF2E
MEIEAIGFFICVIFILLDQSSASRVISNIDLDEDEEIEMTSPGYPDNFDLNVDYLLLVSTSRGRNIHVDFTEVLLRENLDFIYVGDGSSIDETTVNLNLTGRDPVSTSVVSHSNDLWIWFTSGGQGDILAERRFKFEMKETRRISLDGIISAQITSKNYPSDYPDDCHQLWFVSSPSGSRIRIHFTDFATEKEADYLTIGTDWEAVGNGANVLVRYSGEFIPDDVITPVGDVWIKMVTDGRTDDDGFKMTLQSTKLEPTLYNFLPGFQNFNLISPGYPDSEYPNDADISWIITCEPEFKLLFIFDKLDTEWRSDALTLGSGTDPDDVSTMLYEFSGGADGEVALTDLNEMWARFTTDWLVNYDGFSLQIYTVEKGAEERRNITLTSEGQANIFSPDFPGEYPSDSDEVWTITTPNNHLTVIHFEVFALEGVRYDSLTIGTGRQPSGDESVVIGTFGGSAIPDDIESDSPSIWLRFVSDISITDKGFWIVVTTNVIEATSPQVSTTSKQETRSSLDPRATTEVTTANLSTAPTLYSSTNPTSPPYPTHTQTGEPAIPPSENPATAPRTKPTQRTPSEEPSSTRSPAPSTSSDGSMMSSATESKSSSTSTGSTDPLVPGSNAPQTDNKKVVVPTVIISMFILASVLFLLILWQVRRTRNSPPLVDEKDFDKDENLNHSNPAYEYQTIDHIVLNSTHQSRSNGDDSIKKPLPRPPTDIIDDDDDHRYSTYIETMSRDAKPDFALYQGDGDVEKDHGGVYDDIGIGQNEYHQHPHSGSNIAAGLNGFDDLNHAAKSTDAHGDNEVYQEIPYDLDTTEPRRLADVGADKTEGSDISKTLQSDCVDDESLIKNDLYIPMEDEHVYDETRADTCIRDGANVGGRNEMEDKMRKNSDGAGDELYDDTAPLSENFYHIVMRNESDVECLDEQIPTKTTQSDYGRQSSTNNGNSNADEIHDDGIANEYAELEYLGDDVGMEFDPEYQIVDRNESDAENDYDDERRSVGVNGLGDDDANGRPVIDTVMVDNELYRPLNSNVETSEHPHEKRDPEYHIVDRNESVVENDCDDEGLSVGLNGLDDDDANCHDTVGTAMVDNELYRPLTIIETSGNPDENSQTFQNDSII